MKFLVVLAVAVACANAATFRQRRSVESEAPILSASYDSDPDGNFQYGYETGNGISSQVNGNVKNLNTDNPALEIKGTVRYTSPEGVLVEYSWTANENGVAATGSHLPVSPPVPEAILRSLQYIRDHPAPVERVVTQQA